LHALWLLRKVGGQDAGRSGESLYALEKTTALVEMGAYRYIRHPMYSSLLLLAWGIFFKSPSWLAGLLAAVATTFLLLTARAEEVENLLYFGPVYQKYMQRTRRFIPFLW
jgi:protein-S-isoprenylcysteine O-methyltransferase Ste14